MFVRIYKKRLNDKVYKTAYLAEGKRVGKKIVVTHLLNISHLPEEQIQSLNSALKAQKAGKQIVSVDALQSQHYAKISNSRQVGALYVFHQIAKQIGLDIILDNALFLFMAIARIIHPTSKRATAIYAERLPIKEIMNINIDFDENNLYQAMDSVMLRQEKIEDTLFEKLNSEKNDLFLYDVTSSYFEGEKNEISDYGYNRDGKKQIVIGLLTASDGTPVSIEVFKGNTADTKTFKSQIEKVCKRFKVKRVTMVGDKGMIKSTQIEQLSAEDFHYITTITKPQIRSLINKGILDIQLFDDKLMEVIVDDERYIMRRNQQRAQENKTTRQDKINKLKELANLKNEYFVKHKKSDYQKGLKEIQNKALILHINNLVDIKLEENVIEVNEIKETIELDMLLDGCYCIKTNLIEPQVEKEVIHGRYKSLSQVEQDFKKVKTTHLEVRPIYHTKENRTRRHVFLVMLALRLLNEFIKKTCEMEEPIDELISSLNEIVCVDEEIGGVIITRVVKSAGIAERVLEKLGIQIPEVLGTVCANNF
ncbi:MAG: IS1634 family transposase [Nitrospirae bacterium]|nr:IS1634 family transposase [Nitrospirota bacterium]